MIKTDSNQAGKQNNGQGVWLLLVDWVGNNFKIGRIKKLIMREL